MRQNDHSQGAPDTRDFIVPFGAHDLMDTDRNAEASSGRSGKLRDQAPLGPNACPKRQGAGQCYVYLVLPGATDFTTAGRFETETNWGGIHHGRFVYCRDYLNNPNAVPIDPVQLDSLSDTVYRTNKFGGIFSSFRDATPERWGRFIIRHTAPQKPHTRIDYLLQSPDDRSGALGFGCRPRPYLAKRKFYKIHHLERLSALAESMNTDDEILDEFDSRRARDMMLFRTSIGGARPKVVVEDGECLWLAKFNSGNDEFNVARVEHAILELAKICGIDSMRSRVETVANRDVLLVERFDREKTDCGYLRYRMISGFTALRIGRDRKRKMNDWRYVPLVEELRRICAQPAENSKELFSRMVFNALISNTNDSPGNHAFISKQGGWQLSPAYDLMLSPKHSHDECRFLAMSCGIYGRHANARNLLSECERYSLGKEEASQIIDAMEERVRNCWYSIARSAGVSETDCNKIAGAFAYHGFRRAPEEFAQS